MQGLPSERLLVETDACCAAGDAAEEEGRAALLARLVQALAALRGRPEAEIEAAVAANAARFVEALA